MRQPIPELFLKTVRAVHARGAKIAVSWMFAPEFLRPPENFASSFNQAVHETDAVISVSRCTVPQFRDMYGYNGRVHVERYYILDVFKDALPLPPAPPFRFGIYGPLK